MRSHKKFIYHGRGANFSFFFFLELRNLFVKSADNHFLFCLATEVNLYMKMFGYTDYIFDEQSSIMSHSLNR